MITREIIDGTVAIYTLTNSSGARAVISEMGATILSIVVPDRDGNFADVVVGYDSGRVLSAHKGGYMGAIVGRYANRIKAGRFTLNGKTIQLAKNDNGINHLHGGMVGFDKKKWAMTIDGDALRCMIVSPDGEESFPGNLSVCVTYMFEEDDTLRIRYEAVCDKDTIVNLTNHVYLNLAGIDEKDVLNHVVMMNADAFTPIDAESIPTGGLCDVTGTPFDMRGGLRIGDGLAYQDENEQLTNGNGYDHNFVLYGTGMRKGGEVTEPKTGRRVEFFTDMPGVQLYTGNFLPKDESSIGKRGVALTFRKGFCLETQYYPDSINQPDFPQPVLRKGEKYLHETAYRFSAR